MAIPSGGSWLAGYREQLAGSLAASQATSSLSPFELGLKVANTPSTIGQGSLFADNNTGIQNTFERPTPQQWDQMNPFQKMVNSDSVQGFLRNDAVNRTMDVLSRGLYASASAADELVKGEGRNIAQGGESHGGDLIGNLQNTDWGAFLREGWQGLTGANKKTYSDVLAHERSVTNTENAIPDWLKGVQAFAGDVALDPTTYLGPGIARGIGKGVKLGAESVATATGKELPSLSPTRLIKNVFKNPITDPVGNAEAAVAKEGTVTVPDSVANKVVEGPKLPTGLDTSITPGSVVANAGVTARSDPFMLANQGPAIPDWAQSLVKTSAPKSAETSANNILDLVNEAEKTSQSSALSVVKASQYPGVDIPNIFNKTTDIVEKPSTAFVTKQVPIQDFSKLPTQVDHHIATRLINQAPEDWGLTIDKATGDFLKNGKTLTPEEFSKHALEMAKTPEFKKASVFAGKTRLPVPEYRKMLLTGKATQHGNILKNGEPIPLPDYVKSRYEKWTAPVMKEQRVAVNRIDKVPVTTETRASKEALSTWKKSLLEQGVTKEHINALLKASSGEDFATRLAKISSTSKTKAFESLDALEAAAKTGEVPAEEVAKVLKAYGARSFKEAKFKAKQLDARIAKRGENVAARASKILPTGTLEDFATRKDLFSREKFGTSPSVAKVVEEAAKGNDLTKIVPEVLSATEKGQVASALRQTAQHEFVEPLKKWKFETARGAKRTHATPGVGNAWTKGFNKFSQYTLHKNIIAEAKKAVVDIKDWKLRKSAMYDQYMKMLKASEDTMRTHGIEPVLGKEKGGYPLSLHDILSSMPRKLVEDRFMTRSGEIPMTNWLDTADILLTHHLMPPALFEQSMGHNLETLVKDALLNHPGNVNNAFANSVASNLAKKEVIGKAMINRTVADFIKAQPALVEKATLNSARTKIHFGQYVQQLRNKSINNFMKALQDNIGDPNALLKIVMNSDNEITNGVKAIGELPPDGAPDLVNHEMLAAANEVVPVAEMKAVGEVTNKFMAAEGKNAKNAAGIDTINNALHEVANMEGILYLDANDALVWAKYTGWLRNVFPHMANDHVRTIMLGQENVANSIIKAYSKQLTALKATHGNELISQAFKELQLGNLVGKTPEMSKAIEDVRFQMGRIADMGGPEAQAFESQINRFGLSQEHIETFTARNRIKDNAPLFAEDGSATGWTTWDDRNPIENMQKYMGAISQAYAHKQLGETIMREFAHDGVDAISHAEALKRGYVRYIATDTKTPLTMVLDDTKLYSKDIAKELRVLDESLIELAKPFNKNKYMRLYDSATQSLKAGLTFYRPGHHARNLYGDIWLSSMDGLWNPKYYKMAKDVLQSRHYNYEGMQAMLDPKYLLDPKAAVLWMTYKSKRIPLSRDDIFGGGFKKGIFNDYATIEDTSAGSREGEAAVARTGTDIQSILRDVSPFGGKIHDTMASVSEYRDHYVRVAHFMYGLEKQGTLEGRTLEEALDRAFESASARTRKWHPDGSDFSEFEKHKLRRTILFYSFLRKSSPLVLETMMFQPGRFLVYPKAMSALATSQGIDLQGLSDPFPTNQLFPNWMEGMSQGPVLGSPGKYFSVKPGMPGQDLLDQYMSGPQNLRETMMSGVNPFIRTPLELMSKTDFRTQAPISDWSKYFVDQVPMGTTLNNVTGQRIGDIGPSNLRYRPQMDIPGTNVTLDEQKIAGLNWLTGLGLTDMSKPSYIGQGIKDQKQRAADTVTQDIRRAMNQ